MREETKLFFLGCRPLARGMHLETQAHTNTMHLEIQANATRPRWQLVVPCIWRHKHIQAQRQFHCVTASLRPCVTLRLRVTAPLPHCVTPSLRECIILSITCSAVVLFLGWLEKNAVHSIINYLLSSDAATQ